MSKDLNDFIAEDKFSIKKTSTRYEGKMTKDEGIALLDEEKKKLHKLQEKLYADGSKSLLIIIRGYGCSWKRQPYRTCYEWY